MMEFLAELILELIFEGSIEVSQNKKISKWIRYPLILMIFLFIFAIISIILIIGLTSLKENVWIGIFLLSIALIFIFGFVYKFKNIYNSKKK